MELPQIVIPAILYYAVVCALATAASWHLTSVIQRLLKGRRPSSGDAQ